MNKENLPVIAVIISIFALVVALAAWNNTLSPIVSEQAQVKALVQRVELEDLRDRLKVVQGNIEQGVDPQAIQKDLAGIRQDLVKDINTAPNRARLEDIDRQFGILEVGVREGTADILDILAKALNALENEIRYDED